MNRVRNINEAALALIKSFEGVHDGDPSTFLWEPARDPIGIWTLGWGSIWGLDGKRVTEDHPPITQNEATHLLIRELKDTRIYVQSLVNVGVSDNQFSALCSFTYNVGSGNFKASTLRSKLNRGEYFGAADEFPKWRRAGGRILRGLVRRRAAERALFLQPDAEMAA